MNDDLYMPPADPDEEKDYEFDFEDYLASPPAAPGDTIASVLALTSAPAGLTIDTQSNTTTRVKFWKRAGGAAGTTYAITARVQTAGGRKLEMTRYLLVKESGT